MSLWSQWGLNIFTENEKSPIVTDLFVYTESIGVFIVFHSLRRYTFMTKRILNKL